MSVQSGGERKIEEELSITPLPPLPKLRLKPGLLTKGQETRLSTNNSKRSSCSSSSSFDHHHRGLERGEEEEEENEGKTSRLLMKSECRSAGGRRKNGSSLVHSIPKFSEVKKGKLSEVQKVLQSRLLSKQRLKQQQQIQMLSQGKDLQPLAKEEATSRHLSREAPVKSFLPNHLLIQTVHPSDVCSGPSPAKVRRGRKPDKREITHVLKVKAPGPILPHLSEVTITPKVIYVPSPSSQDSEEQALDLRTTSGRASPQFEASPSLWDGKSGPFKQKAPVFTARATSSSATTSFSDLNPEKTIRKFKFTPGEFPCLEEKKSPIRYILDPEKKSNVFMSGDFSTSIPHPSPRLNPKIRQTSFHQRN